MLNQTLKAFLLSRYHIFDMSLRKLFVASAFGYENIINKLNINVYRSS